MNGVSDWVIVGTVGIVAVYKLIERWIDSRDTGDRETDVYSSTEAMPHDVRDDSERRIPDVRLGFQRREEKS